MLWILMAACGSGDFDSGDGYEASTCSPSLVVVDEPGEHQVPVSPIFAVYSCTADRCSIDTDGRTVDVGHITLDVPDDGSVWFEVWSL